MNIAIRLKKARELKGATQTQVSKETGINNKTLSGYERGVSEPDLSTLTLLADHYSVSTDYLLGRTDKQSNKNNNKGNKHNDLSLESQKQLEEYEKLLRIKEQMDTSKDETSSALENEA